MSELLAQYTIPLQSLSEGVHTIQYKIGREFIELQNIENLLNAEIIVKIIFTKRAQIHTLELNMHGTVEIPCDRCLEPVSIAIKNSQECVIKVDANEEEFADNEDVICISSHEKELDITHILYENILLSLPLKKVHAQGKCNADVVAYIKEAQTKQNKTTDPRWDLLKNISIN
jgi:uncharacterized metal-binding protein YceD (DUF177 family)